MMPVLLFLYYEVKIELILVITALQLKKRSGLKQT